jgi:hypothetical protein
MTFFLLFSHSICFKDELGEDDDVAKCWVCNKPQKVSLINKHCQLPSCDRLKRYLARHVCKNFIRKRTWAAAAIALLSQTRKKFHGPSHSMSNCQLQTSRVRIKGLHSTLVGCQRAQWLQPTFISTVASQI